MSGLVQMNQTASTLAEPATGMARGVRPVGVGPPPDVAHETQIDGGPHVDESCPPAFLTNEN